MSKPDRPKRDALPEAVDDDDGPVPSGGPLKPMPVFATPKPARFTGQSEIFSTVPGAVPRNVSRHGQVTALSMMKDEGPFVVEWVAHHLAVGFTDLVVYTNDCSDGTDDMLIRMEEMGLVHHRRNVIPVGQRPQPSALNHAEDDPVVRAADWLLVFDADEFLSIRFGDGTLDPMLDAAVASGANGIVITWRIFGSGGITDWSRAPVTEQYLDAAPPMWNKGWGVKTLFTYDANAWKLGIHRPKMRAKLIETPFPDQVHWLNGSGHPMEDYFKFRGWRSITRTVGYDWVQLNHYAVKSVDSYALRRLRGNVNNKADKYNAGYWSLQDRNEVRDDTMLRYSARRAQIMAGLLADPVVGALHNRAVEAAEARLAGLRETAAYQDLVSTLAAASQVPISQITAAPPQPRDREKIAALMSDVERKRGDRDRTARKANPPDLPPVAVPAGIYVAGPIAADREVPLEWFANHSVELPADPRIFTPVGLDLLRAGRIDRALARRLPALLPVPCRIVDLGAASGFLAAQLMRVRPEVEIVMVERDAGLRDTIRRVMQRNGLADHRGLRLAPADAEPADTIAHHVPHVLLIGDPALTGQGGVDLLARLDALPAMVILHGRMLERGFATLPMVEDWLIARGYVAAFGFDPNIARGFQHG
jgi:Glycosyl transferase family 2